MYIHKPKRLSLVEQVTKQIEELIQQGYWEIGDKIPPETDLMEQFDISRNTLREALRALAHVGLLETKQGSGTIVTSTSVFGAVLSKHVEHRSLLQILEVRMALESEAAFLAAERRTESDIAKMEYYINACQTAFATRDLEHFLKSDIAFHQVIVEASQNDLLVDLYGTLSDSLHYSVESNIIDLNDNTKEQHIHNQLLTAIKEQQAEKASSLVRAYLLDRKHQLVNKTEEL